MRIMLKRKFGVQYIILYLCAFFIVYESGSLPSIKSINDLFIDKGLLFLFLGIIAIFSLKKLKNWNKIFAWCMLFTVFIIINSIVSLRTTPELIYRLFIFLLIYLLLLYTNEKKISFDMIICKSIVFFAISSLMIYIIVHLFNIQIPYTEFYLADKGVRFLNYFGLYYEQGYSNMQFGLNLYRMTGPFWEPGVYQIFLNYALFRYIMLQSKNKLVIFILLIDIFFTMSAAGWICAICILSMRVFISDKISKKYKIILSFFIIVVSFFLLNFIIASKFSETYANKSSAYIRVNDFILSVQLFFENMLFGVGFHNTEVFEMRNFYNNTGMLGSSNGLMTICYTTGLCGLTFILFPFINNIKKSNKNKKIIKLFFFIIILFFNFVEPVYYFPFMIYILANEYMNALENYKFR